MMIVNREYRDFYRQTLETIIHTEYSGLARECLESGMTIKNIFACIMEYLSATGIKL